MEISAIKAIALSKIFGNGGGGSSKFIQGTFKGEESEKGTAKNITVPYDGSGYPVAAVIYPTAGTYKSGEAIYSSTQKKAIVMFAMAKNVTDESPDYSTATEKNNMFVFACYKNSDADPTAISASTSKDNRTLAPYDATGGSATQVIKMSNAKTMSVFIAETDAYGFLDGTEYTYVIAYSA